MSTTTAIEPVDPRRCQAERRIGGPFSLGGTEKFVRCEEAPQWIAAESEPGDDGVRGGMSLCETCRATMEALYPGRAFYLPLLAPAPGTEPVRTED